MLLWKMFQTVILQYHDIFPPSFWNAVGRASLWLPSVRNFSSSLSIWFNHSIGIQSFVNTILIKTYIPIFSIVQPTFNQLLLFLRQLINLEILAKGILDWVKTDRVPLCDQIPMLKDIHEYLTCLGFDLSLSHLLIAFYHALLRIQIQWYHKGLGVCEVWP